VKKLGIPNYEGVIWKLCFLPQVKKRLTKLYSKARIWKKSMGIQFSFKLGIQFQNNCVVWKSSIFQIDMGFSNCCNDSAFKFNILTTSQWHFYSFRYLNTLSYFCIKIYQLNQFDVFRSYIKYDKEAMSQISEKSPLWEIK